MAAWTLNVPVIHFQDPNGSKTRRWNGSSTHGNLLDLLPPYESGKGGGVRDRKVILLFLVYQNTDGLVRQRLVPAADASELTS